MNIDDYGNLHVFFPFFDLFCHALHAKLVVDSYSGGNLYVIQLESSLYI